MPNNLTNMAKKIGSRNRPTIYDPGRRTANVAQSSDGYRTAPCKPGEKTPGSECEREGNRRIGLISSFCRRSHQYKNCLLASAGSSVDRASLSGRPSLRAAPTSISSTLRHSDCWTNTGKNTTAFTSTDHQAVDLRMPQIWPNHANIKYQTP